MRRFLITLGCIVLFTFPTTTFAVDCTADKTTGFVPLACYQGSALQDLYSTQGDNALASFLNKLFTFSLSIGAILAVVMIVWGGYLYMFKDSFASKLNAKEKITNAVIGLLLLLGIYLILYQINPDILRLNITFPKSTSSSQQPVSYERWLGNFNTNRVPTGAWCFTAIEYSYSCFSSQDSCNSNALAYTGPPSCSQF